MQSLQSLQHCVWLACTLWSTQCSVRVRASGIEPAAEDIFLDDSETQISGQDYDDDGIPDRMEQTLYGTNWQLADTDGDGLSDGWEIDNGLDPLDSGEAQITDIEFSNPDAGSDGGDQNETFPDPDNGPNGDPDRDGLTNIEEAENWDQPKCKRHRWRWVERPLGVSLHTGGNSCRL